MAAKIVLKPEFVLCAHLGLRSLADPTMQRCTIFLPLQIVYLFGIRQTFGQFKLPDFGKVAKEIQKAKPNNIEQVLKETKPNDLIHAIKDGQKKVSREDAMKVVGTVQETGAQALQTVQGATAINRNTETVIITTTILPKAEPQDEPTDLAEALKDTNVKIVADAVNSGKIPDVVKDATPQKLAETIQDTFSSGNTKKIADKLLGKDASKVTKDLQDASAKDIITALRGSKADSVAHDAPKSNSNQVVGILDGVKKAANAIKDGKVTSAGVEKVAKDVKEAADALKDKTVSEVLKDPSAQDVLKNPSPDTVKKAFENAGGKDAPEPITDVNAIDKGDASASSSSMTLVVFLVLVLAIGGGLYTFRHFTKPRPVGLPMLEGESNDSYALTGSFFGGSGARELQNVGSSAQGFTRCP